MFYCGKCAKANDWPHSIVKSRGPCEVCGQTRECFSVPSSMLPVPTMPHADKYDVNAIMARVIRYGDERSNASRAFHTRSLIEADQYHADASRILTDIRAMIERMVDNG